MDKRCDYGKCGDCASYDGFSTGSGTCRHDPPLARPPYAQGIWPVVIGGAVGCSHWKQGVTLEELDKRRAACEEAQKMLDREMALWRRRGD